MKRKVLSVMLCAAMVVSMTACGGSDAKENTASANASVSETEQGEATEQDAQEEEPITCTLTVWSPSEDQDPEYGQWLNTMCDQFNELHPNWDITFNYGVCTESDAKKLVPQDIDAAADVFIYSSTGLENLCQANSLAEVFMFYSCVSARAILTTREALIFTCSSVTAPLSMPCSRLS